MRSAGHACALLAMLFELSSSPKPGNVDRGHDFSDVGFHHFLTSAVSAYPIFRKAAEGGAGLGSLILDGVAAWQTWNLSSNTHFGSLVLMVPLAVAAGRPAELQEELKSVLEQSSPEDALAFYRAFSLAGARVVDVESFSLSDRNWEERLQEEEKSLLDLMRLSAGHDLIAREWSTYYQRSFSLSERLAALIEEKGLNDGVVRTYLEALAEVPDSLVQAKFGMEAACEVSRLARKALRDPTLGQASLLDKDLLERDINPGSTADLIAASLFIALLRGLRF
ncbi:MAG: triphosphoribosyl-dephospho-CoA synthase [Methanothrix sp.]|nr:triphosphoribosyl-dephospho-CoA synthase [Methanothrix sp.]